MPMFHKWPRIAVYEHNGHIYIFIAPVSKEGEEESTVRGYVKLLMGRPSGASFETFST